MTLTYEMGAKVSCGIVALHLLLTPAPAAQAETPVAIELVLALDSSASMDAKEFALQVKGIAAAFKDPLVLQAVDDLKPLGVAIAVMQWGGPDESRLVLPFTHITSQRQAKAFGFRAGRGTRAFQAATTSIVTGIEAGLFMLANNGFDGQRQVIDVSGDGEDNSGLDLNQTRENARAAGVTVNGLAIESEEAELADYYQREVTTGAESFVIRATDFDDYGRAIRDKLLRELRPLGS